ncbi:type II secretory pathway protein [Lysinibacillus yapensis]|uniref:Type II secretory pathway protein n=1 Tax=Ureibacillus yapensis TaxID=2304605 RepID=A0A396SHF6_9BACL|nr:competence type IV pilus assembly protein ComGB [Lysinibacillus yapensis]RHW38497.1 type II secretory pathway protein [Lysinibacillus yapensis]
MQHLFSKLSSALNKPKKKIHQLPSFLNRLSTLLQEGYTFSDSIDMLLPYHVDDLEYWRTIVQEKLRNGENAINILQCFPIPKHFLIVIQISEESGKLAESLQTISQQLDFNEKMKKKIISLLTYPVLLSIFMIGIFFAFRTYFLPNITQIINTRTNSDSESSVFLSSLFLRLPDVFVIALLVLLTLVLASLLYIKRQEIHTQIKILMKIPFFNYFYKLHLTKQLAKALGDLLVGGFALQQALEILQSQQLNKILSYVANEIEKQVIYGESLSVAVFKLEWFFPNFEEFIKHGEKSGYLGRELLIYSELLDEKLQFFIKKGVSVMQPLFFIVIAISIIAAYLSILLPMYELIEII